MACPQQGGPAWFDFEIEQKPLQMIESSIRACSTEACSMLWTAAWSLALDKSATAGWIGIRMTLAKIMSGGGEECPCPILQSVGSKLWLPKQE